MKLNFRQGIVRALSAGTKPSFLVYNPSSNFLDINILAVSLLVTAAHANQNFLIEVPKTQNAAWGPFNWNAAWGVAPANINYYIYWDINLATGAITRGFTHTDVTISTNAPPAPIIDRHWFDTIETKMKVWNGNVWLEKCRVFAGSFTPGVQSIVHNTFGSHVGITASTNVFAAGFIAYGNDKKAIRMNNWELMTSETDVLINQGDYSSPVQLEGLSTSMLASEPIPAFHAVAITGLGEIGLADSNNVNRRALGIVKTMTDTGLPVTVVTEGVVYNDQWNWNLAQGKDLLLGSYGELLQGDALVSNSSQKIASILTAHSIIVNIEILVAGDSVVGSEVGIAGPTGPTGPASTIAGPTGPVGSNGIGLLITTNYIMAAAVIGADTDHNKHYRFTSNLPITVEVWQDSDFATPAPIGTVVLLGKIGTGNINIIAGANVTINTPDSLIVSKQFGKITLMKVAANVWEIEGNLDPL